MMSYHFKCLKILSALLMIFVLTNSCVKDKITAISDNSIYTPEFALPVGSHDFSLKDSPMDHLPFIDPAFYPGSLDYLSYNDTFITYIPSITLSSTDPFQFSSITDKTQYITALTLRTNVINGVPDSARIQVYFLDNVHNAIDSAFPGRGLKIDAPDGSLTETPMQTHDTHLSDNILQNLSQVSYVNIVATLYLSGYKATGTKYYSDQHIWVQLGIQVKLELPLNEI
jgi:hypothetical protein